MAELGNYSGGGSHENGILCRRWDGGTGEGKEGLRECMRGVLGKARWGRGEWTGWCWMSGRQGIHVLGEMY